MNSSEGTIFDLYDETGKEERQEQAKKKSSIGRQISLGLLQGAGDIAQTGGTIQGMIQSPLSYGLLSPEQRKKAMANGFNQTDLRKQIADIFGKEVNQQKGIRKGRGFHHETDPNQIRNVIHHYFHQFL
jgi:hypothetical protein